MNTRWCGFKSILADDIQRYLQHKRALGRKFHTEQSVLCLLDRFIRDRPIIVPTAITPQTIEDFLASRRRRPRSYNHLLAAIYWR